MARKHTVSIFPKLLLLFTVVPLVELVLLIWLASVTSLLFTLGLIVVSGIVGAAMIKLQGMMVLHRARMEAAAGRFPGGALFDGMLILMGGALLLTPGILTDVVGFSTLIPPVREMYKRFLARTFQGSFQGFAMRHPGGFHVHVQSGMGTPPSPEPRKEQERESVEGDSETHHKPFEDSSPFDRLKK